MATRTIPAGVDATGVTDVSDALNYVLGISKPGDIIQAPQNAIYLCDKPLQVSETDLKIFWNGTHIKQKNARPFGAERFDITITGGIHLKTTKQLPGSCNWGYVSGTGIKNGTEIVLDADHYGATLSQPCTNGSNLHVVFTSKQDRGRCGFNITGKDIEMHDVVIDGPNANHQYISNLEGQHGYNFQAANGIDLFNVSANHMYGDGMYFGTSGSVITKFVNVDGGILDYNGRSGLSPMNCADVSLKNMVVDHVGRTSIDIEPANATFSLDRFSLTDSYLGTHQLTLLSSGGHQDAHVGAVEFSRNTVANAPMSMWLVVGNTTHKRGPFSIIGNTCTYKTGFGTSYPTASLIGVRNCVGATIQDNIGIVLQQRFPQMAFVRYDHSGPVIVSGNQIVGGIEIGPWI